MTGSLKQPHNRRGFALLLSMIIASVVLAIGVSILKISVSQLQLSATGRESEIAFQASQSLSECLMYYRYENPEWFTAKPGDLGASTILPAPTLNCMGAVSSQAYAEVLENSVGDSDVGHVVRFHYRYSWGGGEYQVCSEGDMYIMKPLSAEFNFPFAGTSVGDAGDGDKTCNGGSVCTILITQGYNRPCDELGNSIFTVQRELTTEF